MASGWQFLTVCSLLSSVPPDLRIMTLVKAGGIRPVGGVRRVQLSVGLVCCMGVVVATAIAA